MTHEYVLWIVVIACALHVLEETLLDFVGVAQRIAPFRMTLPDFYVVNATMIIGAGVGAFIGWQEPAISLITPALIAINAVFFHIGGALVMRRFVPGLITAVVVYLPVAAWVYTAAAADGILTPSVIVLSTIGGALAQAFPIALLALRQRLKRISKQEA